MKIKILVILSSIIIFSTVLSAQDSVKFMANSLSAVNYGLGKNIFFSQIQKDKEINIAFEGFGSQFRLKSDNNIEDIKGRNSGIFVNLDLYENERQNVKMGMLVRYDNMHLQQNSAKSDIKDIGLGGYIGWFNDMFDIKGALRFGYQTYVNHRENAKSEFNGQSAFADFEAIYKIYIKDNMKLKPFLCLDFGFNTSEDFTEKNGMLNLSFEKNTYFRAQTELGLGFEAIISDLMLYCDAGVNFLLSGKENEVKTKTSGYEKIKATELDSVFYDFSLGSEYNLNEIIGFYINGGYRFSQKYNDLYGNIGISYKIGY